MKRVVLKYRDPFAVLVFSFLAMFIILGLSACGGGFSFSQFEEFVDASFDDTGSGDGGLPGVIIPGDEPGSLVPGDSGDDGWTPPDAGDQPDSDGDGYPDPIDFFPYRIFYLCVASYAVSSAETALNEEIIFGTNSFDNTDWVECRVANPREDNTLSSAYTINGSPGDRVEIAVKEYNPGTQSFIVPDVFFTEISRSTGSPEDFYTEFSII